MSDFEFLNEHSDLSIEINDMLRSVYNNAVNAEKFYTISSEKCFCYIREATAEICKMYSICYNINHDCRWLNDYINPNNRLMSSIGMDAYGKLVYIQQNCIHDYCSQADVVTSVMWHFYCACADLHRIFRGRTSVSNTPYFIYVKPAVHGSSSTVKDDLMYSLTTAIRDIDTARTGKTVVTQNSDEVIAVIHDMFDIIKKSSERLTNQEKLINDLTSQVKSFTVQNSLQQKDYERTFSKVCEILELVKHTGGSANIDDVWSKVNTIDEKIQSMESIQKQKLNTVTNFTGGINKTLDRFVEVNEQYLQKLGQKNSPLLSALKKFSNVVRIISENVVTTINNYEKTGQWTYVRYYDGKDMLYTESTQETFSVLEWLADKVNHVADFIRDMDKRW